MSRIDYNNPIDYKNPRKDGLGGTPEGSLGLPYHYEMVSDNKRIGPLKEAINRVCGGKRVLESGTGSAILSILAAKAGAEKVYAVEIDPLIYEFARKNIEKSGFENIKLIKGDIREITLVDLDGERVDVIIAENLSTWQVMEPQIPILNYVNEHLLRLGGIKIPNAISNNLELAQSIYRFEDIIDLRTLYFEFTGIKKPKILSDIHLFQGVDFNEMNDLRVNKSIVAKVKRSGILNSLRLTSPLQVHRVIFFGSSDSLMPPVIIPLEKDILVSRGDVVEITIEYGYNTNWDEFKCSARKID